MTELTTSYERLAESPAGPIAAVVYGGKYLPGSEGNEFCLAMINFLRTVMTEAKPAAVLFDLTALDYVWGDAIAGLAMPLLEEGTDSRFRPSVIVATGTTAQALAPLVEQTLLGLAGMRIFSARHEAIAHLQGLLK